MKKIRRIRNLVMACFLCACMITPTNIVFAQEEAREENTVEDGSTPSTYAYDFDAPVVEKIEFPQSNQVVKAGTTVTVYIDAYDAGSGIREIIGGISVGNSLEDAVHHTQIIFVKENEGNRYKGDFVVPSGFTYGFLSGVTVTDKNGNFTTPDIYQYNNPIYPFTIQNESTTIYDIESIDFPQNEQTVTHNAPTTMQIKLTSNSNQDLQSLNAVFTEKVSGEIIQLYLSKNENGIFVTENAMLSCASGFYTLTGISGYKSGNIHSQLQLPEQRYSFTMDSVNEGIGPIIKSIQMDKKGQTLTAKDQINFEIVVEDVADVNKEGAQLYLSPVVSLAYDYGNLELTFDETTQTFKGTYTIPETMYPCEWYVSTIYLTDKYENQADTSKILPFNHPFYFNVVKDGDFTSPTYDVSLSFRKLNDQGEFEFVKEFKKDDVERRTTLKDAGLIFPDGSTTYKDLKFEGWKNYNQELISEDYVITNDMYETVYASYDKIPLSVSYTYMDKNMQNKTIQNIVLAEKGMTYAQALAMEDTMPNDMYAGAKFEGWKLNQSQNINLDSVIKEGEQTFLNLNASFDKVLLTLRYQYVDDNMNFKNFSHVIIAEKGMTYAEAFTLDKEKPTDLYSGIKFEGWKMMSEVDFNVDDVIDVDRTHDYHFQASYNKNFAQVSYSYVDEKMQSKNVSHVLMIDKETTYKDLITLDKNIPTDVTIEATFKYWDLYADDNLEEQNKIRNYDYIHYKAVFDETPVNVRYTYSTTSYEKTFVSKTMFVQAGSTYKNALKDIRSFKPDNMIADTKFREWRISLSSDENSVIPESGAYVEANAIFEQIPMNLYFDYYNEKAEYSQKSIRVLMEHGDTYGDILKKDIKIPTNHYANISFLKWNTTSYENGETEGDKIDINKPFNHMFYEAEYDKIPVFLSYNYLDKDKTAKTVKNLRFVENYEDIYQELAQDMDKPTDVYDGYVFEKWETVDNSDVQGDMLRKNVFNVYPVYENKKFVYTMQYYYDEQGYNYQFANAIFANEQATYNEVYDEMLKQDAPASFNGLRFEKWRIDSFQRPNDIVESASFVQASAIYENAIVRIKIDDIYKGGWGNAFEWKTGITEEQTYLEAYAVEKGTQFIVPELSNFENLKLFYYTDLGFTDLHLGNCIQVNQNIDIYGYENSGNEPEEPVDPTPPVTPEEPEKPVDPTPPITPEEPEEPVKPTPPITPEEPEEPSNPSAGENHYMPEQVKKEVIQEIVDKPNGAKVTVDMKDANVVSKDILEAAKGKDIVVELQFKGYTWLINGNDILATNLADINLEVSFDQNIIPNKVISDLAKDNPIKQLSLTHNGDFGFKATLNVNVGSEYVGKYGNLYYYDSTGKLVYMNAGEIDGNGNVSLEFTHASEYVIVVNEQILGEEKTSSSQNNTGPATGDSSDIAMMTFSMLISCGCLLFVKMKKKI